MLPGLQVQFAPLSIPKAVSGAQQDVFTVGIFTEPIFQSASKHIMVKPYGNSPNKAPLENKATFF